MTPSIAEIQRIAAAELSTRPRVRYVLLLVVSATMLSLLASLWITEPALPLGTNVAFGLMAGILLSWVVFALWVLTRRRVLFGRDRLVASRMALGFSVASVIATLAIGSASSLGRQAYVGALAQLPLCAIAAAMLVRARRRVHVLLRRRQELETRGRAASSLEPRAPSLKP